MGAVNRDSSLCVLLSTLFFSGDGPRSCSVELQLFVLDGEQE